MAARHVSNPLRGIISQLSRTSVAQEGLANTRSPNLTRSITTQSTVSSPEATQLYPSAEITSSPEHINVSTNPSPAPIGPQAVTATIFSFPALEPLRFEYYPANYLYLPTRRDILHRAIVYEGDMTRLGTASTKWREEVHGSTRKVRPQKGSGKARLGDKKSPMLRGGGVAFGPKPRDFSTKLPRKVYDLAWRTALSYRYRKGELIIVDESLEMEDYSTGYAREVFEAHQWGRPHGRSLLVTEGARHERQNLFRALDGMGEEGRALPWEDVDVKDLLEMGRIVVERGALARILEAHQTDLTKTKRLVNKLE
ncbi:ribosomal protein L4 [Lophium mytilinum]|uniref:Large ribosomal subunit protein uL4m n=1 Tax=Lophium mytilinum TaxID=390894 RepID=A0A6A6RD99_9PEZI|nr:ribosomal protein L4 [Lophium mytilinum]